MLYRTLADLLVLAHLAFIVFVVLGGLLALHRRWFALLHLPAAAWGVFIEITGGICPLTPLENELRRSPEDKEVATELGMTEQELATVLGQISFVGVVALDELLSAGSERGSGATVGDTIAGGGHDPVEAFESEEMRQVLADAINRMPDRERLVLTLYYYEGLTLAEIGGVLGVTESRVCQIHTKAILQLRSRLVEPASERLT